MKKLEDFDDYTYSKQRHLSDLDKYSVELYEQGADFRTADLKKYQDLLVAAFLRRFIADGSRILEVGGGCSRILHAYHKRYECWNVDPLEGVGNGPLSIGKVPYKVVLDYMGNFNRELPDGYFDFVFSVSALEHAPQEQSKVVLLLEDIQRVLKPSGLSLHLLDSLIAGNDITFRHPFITEAYLKMNTFGSLPDSTTILKDPDLYIMSKEAYDIHWKKYTNTEYEQFGKPFSINILWRK